MKSDKTLMVTAKVTETLTVTAKITVTLSEKVAVTVNDSYKRTCTSTRTESVVVFAQYITDT